MQEEKKRFQFTMRKIILIIIVSLFTVGCSKNKNYYSTQMKGIKASYKDGRISKYEYQVLKQRAKEMEERHRSCQE